jgi:hypothetical protein
MSNDDIDYFSYDSSSENYHEHGQSLTSHIYEDQRLSDEKERQEEERIYNETYGPFNRQVERWRTTNDPDTTFCIVKIINNTAHDFKLTQISRRVTDAEKNTLHIPPKMPKALLLVAKYHDPTRPGSAQDTLKTRFEHFVNYSGETTELKIDIGLTVKGYRGAYTYNHSHNIVSTGETHVRCKSKITHWKDRAPFDFEVLITLD